jgi:hypothetical protein
MWQSPIHEEIHDKTTARATGGAHASTGAQHQAPRDWTLRRVAKFQTLRRVAKFQTLRRVAKLRYGVQLVLAWLYARIGRLVATVRGAVGSPADLVSSMSPIKVAVAVGAVCCLGVAAVSQGLTSAVAHHDDASSIAEAAVNRQLAEHASRSSPRASQQAKGKAAKAKSVAPKMPTPVAGLNQTQMNNAYAIVRTGQGMRLPKRAYVIAVATAMQESRLFNLASDVIPESLRYPHEGTGSDHDSVGLFQQRPSSGWGSVHNLMRPSYAATQFYRALLEVPGWQGLPLTLAAQAVQGSAFPDAYAVHEWGAQKVVDALT